MHDFIKCLDQEVLASWQTLRRGSFYGLLESGLVDQKVYADVLAQIYHCALCQPIHQSHVTFAFAGGDDEALLKLLLRLAADDIGTEKTIMRDLLNLNQNYANNLLSKAPLPATVAIVAYLYFVVSNYHPIARLSYRYILLQSYGYIQPYFAKCKDLLQLTENQTSFIRSIGGTVHNKSSIVRKTLIAHCINKEQQEQIIQVGITCTYLLVAMLNAVADQRAGVHVHGVHEGLVAA